MSEKQGFDQEYVEPVAEQVRVRKKVHEACDAGGGSKRVTNTAIKFKEEVTFNGALPLVA